MARRAPRGLSPAEDAYGQILLAVLEGRASHEIMERDDGVVYCGDPRDYFAPFRRWPPAERRAMRFVRGRVLDVGCGAGRVSLHLEARGHDVVAIDESPLAIEVARRRGVRDARVLALAEVDASLGVFDTVIVARNNLGLAGDGRRARTLLRRLGPTTTARGRIVTDSVHPDRVDADLRVSGRVPRYRVRWRSYASPWFRYLMLEPAELEPLVAGTGWRVAGILDDGSPRYGIVLEKEARAKLREAST
jgi:SAM-dependent methyltransferase